MRIRKFKPAKIKRLTLQQEINALKRMRNYNKNRGRKPVIVHLGNIDDYSEKDGLASKTASYSERFPKFKFIGIDLTYLYLRPPASLTWEQLKASFESGLKKLKDNSVDIISSEMALGYYGSNNIFHPKLYDYKEHTCHSIKIAYKKLRKGGKLLIAVGDDVIDLIKQAVKEAGFRKNKVEIRLMTEKERKRTTWLSATGWVKNFYQITAKK